MPPLGLSVTKLQRNMAYETIAKAGIDPAQFDLDQEDTLLVTHNAGSMFKVVWSDKSRIYRIRSRFRKTLIISAVVEDGSDKTYTIPGRFRYVLPKLKKWADEVKQVVEAPDYWEDLKRNREFMADAQSEDSSNAPFTKDEQDQIAAQLQTVKKFVAEKFELTSDQITHIEERLDEAAEASRRMGRKDWLLLFSGTMFSVIITDIVTPSVAEHIFTMVIHGIGHLFTGRSRPPQIPPPIVM